MGPKRGRTGDRIDWSRLAGSDPDLVVLSPCSFSVERSQREIADPAVRNGLASLRPRLGVFVADEAYFSRPGPRLADGVDLVRHLLQRSGWHAPMPFAPVGTASSEIAP